MSAGRTALALLLIAASGTAQAQSAFNTEKLYLGLRGGAAWNMRDDFDYLRDLRARGHEPQVIAVDASDWGGTAYIGWQFSPRASLELGYVQLGQFSSAVYAPNSDARQLAVDAAELQPDAGNAVSLNLRVQRPLWRSLKLYARGGPFYWWQGTKLQVGDERIDADRKNLGFMVGGGLDLQLSRHWSLGAGTDLYRTSSSEPLQQVYAQIEYHF